MNDPITVAQSLTVYGPLGIFCVLLIIAVIFLYKENKQLQREKLEIAVQSRDAIVQPLKDLQEQERSNTVLLQSIAKLIQK